MKYRVLLFFFPTFLFFSSCNPGEEESKSHKYEFVQDEDDQTIEVVIDEKPFTTLRWSKEMTKPVLHPIYTASGTAVTRGFPLDPKVGERADHPHQIGSWLTYGNVNGSDFWGNGSRGLNERNRNGGVIQFRKVTKMSEEDQEGVLTTLATWIDSSGLELLDEETTYHFVAEDSIRIIDRITTLTAKTEVSMPDTKEGMFGIRVARELELPDQGSVTLYSSSGEPEKVKSMDNSNITGNYVSSEGVTGMDVWSTRARWMNLYGNIGGENISLVICDHPDNLSYPTWWHARGYGLYAANPLGAKDFTDGEEEIDYSMSAGQSLTFRYRMIISSGFHMDKQQIDEMADVFGEKY